MFFLSDVMEPRELKGSLSPPEKHTSGINNSQDDKGTMEHQDSSSASETGDTSATESQPSCSSVQPVEMGPPATTPTKGKRKRLDDNKVEDKKTENKRNENKKTTNKKENTKTERSEAQFLEIQRAKLKLFSKSTAMKKDSDCQFLISLLPYLKKVPHQQN